MVSRFDQSGHSYRSSVTCSHCCISPVIILIINSIGSQNINKTKRSSQTMSQFHCKFSEGSDQLALKNMTWSSLSLKRDCGAAYFSILILQKCSKHPDPLVHLSPISESHLCSSSQHWNFLPVSLWVALSHSRCTC